MPPSKHRPQTMQSRRSQRRHSVASALESHAPDFLLTTYGNAFRRYSDFTALRTREVPQLSCDFHPGLPEHLLLLMRVAGLKASRISHEHSFRLHKALGSAPSQLRGFSLVLETVTPLSLEPTTHALEAMFLLCIYLWSVVADGSSAPAP